MAHSNGAVTLSDNYDISELFEKHTIGGLLCFKSWHNLWMRGELDGRLVCNSSDLGPWEKFGSINADPPVLGDFYLKTSHGTYVRQQGITMDHNANKKAEATVFQILDAGMGRVAFRVRGQQRVCDALHVQTVSNDTWVAVYYGESTRCYANNWKLRFT